MARAIVIDWGAIKRAQDTLEYQHNESPGISVHVRLADLIEAVFVSPGAPVWFYNAVRRVTKLVAPAPNEEGMPREPIMDPAFPVYQSKLDAKPLF